MSDDAEYTGRGRIGNEIFDQVERLVSEGGLSRTQAFQRVSEDTGRRAGTVAANYYRVARQRGATLQPRTPRGPRSSTGKVESALARAQQALGDLAEAVREQQEEIAELRTQGDQLERLRALVSKSL